MTTLRAVYNPTTRVANVDVVGTAIPGGSVAIGTFEHPDPVYTGSLVTFHAVRDLLYKRSAVNPANSAMFPKNITDMENISITSVDLRTLVELTGLSLAATGGTSFAAAATKQLVPTFTPSNASDKVLVYTSSNTLVATVNASTGLVTGVAAGAVTITATGDNGVSANIALTVTA